MDRPVLRWAVKELGLKDALINGHSNLGPNERVQYLDEELVREFWHRVAALGVPVYLHPREPLPSQRRVLQGYPELVGSAWGCLRDFKSCRAVDAERTIR
jgi:gamma-resorcylate decarboxylase